MKNYVILYRLPHMLALDPPMGFQAWAEDVDHAEEQCIDSEPDADIVWAWEGAFGVGTQPALDEYYNQG